MREARRRTAARREGEPQRVQKVRETPEWKTLMNEGAFNQTFMTGADYAKWVDGKKKELAAKADDPSKVWKQEELVARGEKVYNANCAACHRPDGKGAGPIKPLDGSAIVQNDPAQQIKIVLNGAANGAMPAWKQLSDTEIAAVITYTKNSWSNQTGKVIQPAEFAAARAK